MAQRYWVGGTGSWTDTTHWSDTSGGAGGFPVPTSADDVYFDLHSNEPTDASYTCSGMDNGNCNNLDVSFIGGSVVTLSGTTYFNVYGNFNLSGGASQISYELYTRFKATTSVNINFNNVIPNPNISVVFDGINGIFTLKSNIVLSDIRTIYVTNGRLNCNSYSMTCGYFSVESGATLDLGSATHIILASLFNSGIVVNSSANIICGTSTIKYIGTAERKFDGGGKIYNNLWINPGSGTGTFHVIGSNTFNNFKDDGTSAHIIDFVNGSTQTINSWNVSGTSGNLITINSTTTGTFNLIKSNPGKTACDYLNIQHCIATPANTWYAGENSVNNQGVSSPGSGWIFSIFKSVLPTFFQ